MGCSWFAYILFAVLTLALLVVFETDVHTSINHAKLQQNPLPLVLT